MIEIAIPGSATLSLEHLVLDFNGTLASDGKLISDVPDLLKRLSSLLSVHVLTADTFGRVTTELQGLPCRLSILAPEAQDEGKRHYVEELGAGITVCIGNGRNDKLMLREAALGIAVVLAEGAAVETVLAADVICQDIASALGLLLNPLRLAATLRV